MTDRPYTDDDLRTEAARQLANAIEDPDFTGIGEQMEGEKIASTEDLQWDQLGDDDFDTARRAIDDLINGAADVSQWAVQLGADGLEPYACHIDVINFLGGTKARLHIAFADDLTPESRAELLHTIATSIAPDLITDLRDGA